MIEKALPVGHIAHRKDGDYKKLSDGSWEEVPDEKSKGFKEPKKVVTESEEPKFIRPKFKDYTGDPEYERNSNNCLRVLTKPCLIALRSYQAHFYGLNKGLRKDIKDVSSFPIKSLLPNLDKAFKDAPINGKTLPSLFRGVMMKAEDLAKLVEGSSFKDKAFVSTSSKKTVALDFLEDIGFSQESELQKVLLVIKDGESKSIPLANLRSGPNLDKNPGAYIDEKEYLLNRDSEFKVIKRTTITRDRKKFTQLEVQLMNKGR